MASTKKIGPDSSERLMNFLIGQVMRQTSGRASPETVRQMILERLDKEPDVL